MRRADLGFLRKAQTPPFDRFAEDYLAHAKRSKRSWKRDEVSLQHLKAFFKSKRLSAISSFDIERYKVWREGQATAWGHAPSKPTIDRELCVLRRLFNVAVAWKKTKSNPVTPNAFSNEKRERMYILGEEEERRLIEAAALHLKPIIRLALGTGMRKGEVLGLRWRQIDFRRQVIALAAEDSNNKKADTVPLNSEMIDLLRELPHEGRYVFGGEHPFQDVKTAFRTALRKADLPSEIRFHDLRHTFATRLARLGVDAATLMALLRHSSLKMVMRYVHPAEKTKRQAVELLSNHGHDLVTLAKKAHLEAQAAGA